MFEEVDQLADCRTYTLDYLKQGQKWSEVSQQLTNVQLRIIMGARDEWLLLISKILNANYH